MTEHILVFTRCQATLSCPTKTTHETMLVDVAHCLDTGGPVQCSAKGGARRPQDVYIGQVDLLCETSPRRTHISRLQRLCFAKSKQYVARRGR